MFRNHSRRSFCLSLLAVAVLIAAGGVKIYGDDKPQTVRLIIDYNDGAQKVFPAIPWKPDMTVKDALDIAQQNPHGIKYEFDKPGGPDTYFLQKIDDLHNEGAGANKKNWLYWVNDKFADRGFGVYKLQAGDTVVWKFDVFKENAK